jgi:hypothetical protein
LSFVVAFLGVVAVQIVGIIIVIVGAWVGAWVKNRIHLDFAIGG